MAASATLARGAGCAYSSGRKRRGGLAVVFAQGLSWRSDPRPRRNLSMMSGIISGPDAARTRITVESHLALSATINWHLSARRIDLGALLRVILGPARASDHAPLL